MLVVDLAADVVEGGTAVLSLEGEADAESSRSPLHSENEEGSDHEEDSEAGSDHEEHDPESVFDPAGFAGPKTVKPLTREALAAFQAAQDKAGIIYISRIPPGMRPAKVRHLMSAYGEVGRVYLQQEGTCAANTS